MTSREDCEKWMRDNFDDLNIPEIVNVLHEFSKTTIGHFPADSRTEEEIKYDRWVEEHNMWGSVEPSFPAEEEKQKGSL